MQVFTGQVLCIVRTSKRAQAANITHWFLVDCSAAEERGIMMSLLSDACILCNFFGWLSSLMSAWFGQKNICNLLSGLRALLCGVFIGNVSENALVLQVFKLSVIFLSSF